MSIKINSFEIEGVKRVKAVALSPAENGLTIIGDKRIRRHCMGARRCKIQAVKSGA